MKTNKPFMKTRNSFSGEIGKLWLLPILFYFIMFCILTYPLIFKFHTHFFTDTGDGLQNVWNLWWINKAVTGLHQSPWYTTYLHYPNGTTLIGQTLNPFNGFMGIFLLKFSSLIETHNFIVIFSFVMGGFTAYGLSYYLTKSYWGSLAAGYIFTFSQYHFMHAEGHLQLVSLEWIPLFILCWYKLINSPSLYKAVISAMVLYLVLLCDHYYFLFCVLAAILLVLWHAVSTGNYLFLINRRHMPVLLVFLIAFVFTSGVPIFHLLRINSLDPLLGSHNPYAFSLDLLAPFIPGGHWRFAPLTEFYWSKLPGNIHESSVYMGLSAVILIIYTWFNRKRIRTGFSSLSFWYLIMFFFGILSLGPALKIAGKNIYSGIMPYEILNILFPPLELSGCPVRMMVMVMLGASVISAAGLSALYKKDGPKWKLFMISLLMALLFFDTLPKPVPSTRITPPEYIDVLKRAPDDGGVIDTVSPSPFSLYYQTIHGKPLGMGYISRYPTSVYREYMSKVRAVQNHEYSRLLEEYNIRYLITDERNNGKRPEILKILYENKGIVLYRITGLKQAMM